MNAAVPKLSFGSNDPSHTARAVPVSIAEAMSLQLSASSLNLS